jgi:hypothetical protein
VVTTLVDSGRRFVQARPASTEATLAERSLPWGRLLLWALLGTVLGTLLVLMELRGTSGTQGGLVHTGPDGPTSALIARDFPDQAQYTYGESDGPMFYAIARDLWDLDRAAESLDRPRYRLNRPVYPFFAWLLHPSGGGTGLVISLFVVNIAAMAIAAVSMGALSAMLRGPVWLGALAPLVPGAQMAMRITCADLLATALMLAATALLLRGRWGWATAVAVLAVLTKEPVLLTFIGLALWRRDRRSVTVVLGAVGALAAWTAYIRLRFADSGQDVIEFGLPLVGIADAAIHAWSKGDQIYGLLTVVLLAGLAITGFVRHRLDHPLGYALLLNLALVSLLSITPVGLDRNGPRSLLPAVALAMVMATTPARWRDSPQTTST